MKQSSRQLSNGTMTALRNRIDEIEPLLEEQRFSTNDIQANPRSKHIVRYLNEQGAVYKVGQERKRKERGRTQYKIWEWNPAVLEHLREYAEDRDVLPCGHRPHIWNAPGFDGLMCQKCMEHGIRTSLEKETVKELL